jgi:hypothetical protein
MRVRVLVLVAALLLFACTLTAPRYVLTFQPMYLGMTDCVNGMPVSVVQGGMSPADSLEVDVHEAKHRQQMYRRCDAFQRRFRADSRFRMRMEFEAYCAGIATRPPGERPFRRETVIMYAVAFGGLQKDETRRLFTEVCP